MKIRELCDVIRSKNAGPYELTFDMIFKSQQHYNDLKASGKVTKEKFAALYGIAVSDIKDIIWFEPAHALKVTIKRPTASGSLSDKDIYGAQQHGPLLQWDL